MLRKDVTLVAEAVRLLNNGYSGVRNLRMYLEGFGR